MIPLAVLVLGKPTMAAVTPETSTLGLFAYPVPEFTWERAYWGPSFEVSRKMLKARGYDMIFHVDGGSWGRYLGSEIPAVFWACDSTLSMEHYSARRAQADRCDLVLVDHDTLSRWHHAVQFPHCVNDHVFRDYGEPKTVDVSFHCSTSKCDVRRRVRHMLDAWAQERGWVYRSGVLGFPEYQHAMSRTRVVVNWPRVGGNRPHRLFDAMACRAAVITGEVPVIPEDLVVPGKHYIVVKNPSDLGDAISETLVDGRWDAMAETGYNIIKAAHTWAVRAQQLRSLIHERLAL